MSPVIYQDARNLILNLLRALVFHFERLDILRDSIGHPSQKLLRFEFDVRLRFQFVASEYIMGLNQTSDLKVFAVLISRGICSEFRMSRYIMGLNRTSE